MKVIAIKFGVLKIKPQQQIKLSPFFGIMPETMKESHIRKKTIFELREMNIGRVYGFEITIPFGKKEIEELPVLEKSLNKRLSELEISVVACPAELEEFISIDISQGDYILPFFAGDAAVLTALENKVPLQDARYLVLDDGSERAEIILESLVHRANHIALATDRAVEFVRICDKILEEWGLALEILPFSTDSSFADVVIDCIQKDFGIMEDSWFEMDKKVYSAALIEAAEYIKNPAFRLWRKGGYYGRKIPSFRNQLVAGGLKLCVSPNKEIFGAYMTKQ